MNGEQTLLGFLIGEIPFLLFMAFLIYLFWIRPKRMEKHEAEDAKETTFFPGDRILFEDGMVGNMVKRSSSYITITSGPKNEVFERRSSEIITNLSCDQRKREAYQKLPLKDKILRKV